MAYAALISFTQTIEKIILNEDRYSISPHHKQQILSLDKYSILLQQFLEDFPDKAKANSLEGQIRDAANKAEDIIEFYMWKRTHSRFHLTNSIFIPANFAKLRFKLRLRKTMEEFDSITGKAMAIKNSSACAAIKEDLMQVKINGSAAARSSSSSRKISDTVGLDDDLLEIKSRLCGETGKLEIIPIVGMGGIGKTTLARNAYDDPLSMQHFHIRAWVTVSQDCSTHQILSSLFVSLKLPGEEIPRENESVKVEVYKSLKGRRYLIVLDDMWSTEAWDDVRHAFPDDGNGSRIMVTTRLSDVASYPDRSSASHEMRLMDADQSWDLLRAKVFKGQDPPPELANVGKKIAESCEGLPLAVVVIGGLLSTVSKSPDSWWEIAKNVNSVVAAKDGQFEEILSLSYTHLPHRLRPCFLYLGGFPEDYEIRVSFLVRLWVAEGFLQPQSESKSLEDFAEECLEDLVQRSLVMVIKRKTSGKIKSCRLHDLVRDLCIQKAHGENFLADLRVVDVMRDGKTHRRVSNLSHLPKSRRSTVHTVMCFKSFNSICSLKSLKLLRVLVAGVAYHSLPNQLFELYHLRLLAMVYSDKVPAAIANLRNLETLIILERRKESGHVARLPQAIWRMPQLRHVVYYGRLPYPRRRGRAAASTLENLQTLSSLPSFMCTEKIMEMIPNVRKLKILCYEYGAYLNNLAYLPHLENLELCATSYCQLRRSDGDEFSLPKKLKKLTLSRLRLPWKEMTMIGSLPNLQVLKLRHFACHGKTWETTEGGFPQLEFLLIEESNLEQIVTRSSHFPRLRSLVLHNCGQLIEIPDDIGEIPTLELIEVTGRWKKSLVESAIRIQEELQSYGNDVQVCCSSLPEQSHWAQRICF